MTIREFVDELYGDQEGEMANVKTFLDRLLLRIFDTVGLMQYLNKVSVIKKGDVQTIQLVFAQIPDEVISDVQRVIAVPSQAYKFKSDAANYVGFEIPLKKELFPPAEGEDSSEEEPASSTEDALAFLK